MFFNVCLSGKTACFLTLGIILSEILSRLLRGRFSIGYQKDIKVVFSACKPLLGNGGLHSETHLYAHDPAYRQDFGARFWPRIWI